MSAPLVQDIDLTNDPQIRGNKILEDIDRIRDITPAYWSETNRCWLVTRHKDVAAIYSGKLPLGNKDRKQRAATGSNEKPLGNKDRKQREVM